LTLPLPPKGRDRVNRSVRIHETVKYGRGTVRRNKRIGINMEVDKEEKGVSGEVKKKKSKNKIKEEVLIKGKRKFYVDYSGDENMHGLVVELINKANDKKFGRTVVFKDLIDISLKKLTTSDIERVQKATLEEMDKVLMQLEIYNDKHKTNLKLGEYLVRQLKL
jgi:hypothetical protein